jgi:AcrR family transcriptional regulator
LHDTQFSDFLNMFKSMQRVSMGRRSDHTREELIKLFLASARRFAEEEGLGGIVARRVARDVGYAAGTINNVFGSLDGLVICLRLEVLDEMYAHCASVPLDAGPVENLQRLAAAYTDFVLAHPNLWGVLFEHRTLDPAEWDEQKVLRLFGLVERAIASLFDKGEDRARHHEARVLWASLHGIVSLGVADKTGREESIRSLTRSLIDNYVFALKAKYSGVRQT